jgi:hypothetical protein
LNEAMNQEIKVNKFDLAELRSMKKPPKVIKIVIHVVCILLDVKPVLKTSKKTNK